MAKQRFSIIASNIAGEPRQMTQPKKSYRHKWNPEKPGRAVCSKCGCVKQYKDLTYYYFLPNGTKAGFYAPDCSPEPKINGKAGGSKNPY